MFFFKSVKNYDFVCLFLHGAVGATGGPRGHLERLVCIVRVLYGSGNIRYHGNVIVLLGVDP